jgi:ribosomal protein S3AE
MASKKKFIEVSLPMINDSISVLGTPENLEKRTVKIDMTRRLKGKSLEIVFQIFNKDNKLYGLPKSLNLMKFFIIRMMRKRASYVEDSFVTNCKDVQVTIKPFLITRKRVSRAVRNHLRKTAKDFLLEYVKDKNFLEVCRDILSSQLQREMLPKLKKVYPLSFCEIRVFETKQINNVIYVKEEKKEIKAETIIAKPELIEETQADEIDKQLAEKKEAKSETIAKAIETTKESKEKKVKKTSKKEAKKE